MSACNTSTDTAIHLYDHTIKPILLYCSEIWGSFKINSAACKKKVIIYLN